MATQANDFGLFEKKCKKIYPPILSHSLLVCPHCLTAVKGGYQFETRDGVSIESFVCARHGDVVPRRSAIQNPPHSACQDLHA